MRKQSNYYLIVTASGKAVCETLAPSRRKSLSRYKEKWLRSAYDPDREWERRRKRGYKVSKATDYFTA